MLSALGSQSPSRFFFYTNRKNLTGEKDLSSGQVFSAGLSRGQSAKGGMAAVEAVNGCGNQKVCRSRFPRTNRPALYLQARLNTGLSRSPDLEILSAARPSQENSQ